MAGRLDFARVAAAALAAAESLVAQWLPEGHREGGEWKARNPTRADARIGSFSVNLATGAWADFATDDRGGDLVALYAYLNRLTQGAAAKALAAQCGIRGADSANAPRPTRTNGLAKSAPSGESDALGAAPTKARSEWVPLLPVPDDAPEPPKAHVRRGKPAASWAYRDASGKLLGFVHRFTTSDGGKEVLPMCFAQHRATGAREWRWLAFPEPRPLYGLHELTINASAQVLVVEGEKCADAARSALGAAPALVTWPGGSKAVDKADWTPLAGRRVILWPDADAQRGKDGALLPPEKQPGIVAMERVAATLGALGCAVRIVDIPAPGAKPAGWDVADAIAEGWNGEQLRAFIRDHLREPGATTALRANHGGAGSWEDDLVRGNNGALLAVQSNAYLMLANRDEWAGVLAFDEFAQRTVKRKPPPYARGVEGDWTEMDDSFAGHWLATRAGMPRVSTPCAAEAAEMAARQAPFDPVCHYLDSLVWDRVERAQTWVSEFLGAPADGYAALVGRLWLVGMVRRAKEPGCKFDFMPILEGPQGRGKTTALEILARPWFGNTDFVVGDKDSMAVLQGKWLYEIAELDSFHRADATRMKSFVSRTVDEFRPAYGRRILRVPRRAVLVGTTNQHEYLKDSTGNRRFWPLQCRGAIDLDGLARVRDQLFAEALVRLKDGEPCYPTREEQDALVVPQQERREIADAWEQGVHVYLERPDDLNMRPPEAVSTYDILVHGLKIDVGKITREMTTRIGMVMRKLGWEKFEQRGRHPRYVYKRPQKSACVTTVPEAGDELPV